MMKIKKEDLKEMLVGTIKESNALGEFKSQGFLTTERLLIIFNQIFDKHFKEVRMTENERIDISLRWQEIVKEKIEKAIEEAVLETFSKMEVKY